MTPAMLSGHKSASWNFKEATLPVTAVSSKKRRLETVPLSEGANKPETKHRGVREGRGHRQRPYLRGHAAALAVGLGDELVEEQVDLRAAGTAIIRAKGAEPGRQTSKPTPRLKGWLPRRLWRRPAWQGTRDLRRRHLSYVG